MKRYKIENGAGHNSETGGNVSLKGRRIWQTVTCGGWMFIYTDIINDGYKDNAKIYFKNPVKSSKLKK